MRKMSKRIGALLLAVLMLFQTCAGNVYAAPLNQGSEITVESEGNFEGTSNETYIEPVTGIEIPDIREEVAQYIDTDILDWVEENIPKDKTKLSKMPQEWWDSLTPSQRKIAEIQLEALDAQSNETHYCNQTLQEAITILEKGEISAKDFFAGTIIKNITLDDLYRLRDLNISLNELVDAIYGIMEYEGYEMPESEELFEIAVMASGYSPFTTYASQNPGGEATTGVTRVNTKNTGYTDGRGNSFWHITTTTGQNVYCYKHGASCSRTYTYGNMKQVTGEAALKTMGRQLPLRKAICAIRWQYGHCLPEKQKQVCMTMHWAGILQEACQQEAQLPGRRQSLPSLVWQKERVALHILYMALRAASHW